MLIDDTTPDSGDQRSQRTRARLRQALIALILEKGFEAVTTREIAGRAEVSYKTFYRHYANKEELLFDVLTSLGAELNQQLLPAAHDLNRLEENALQFFQYVVERADLLRILLDRQVAVLMLDPLRPFTDRWLRVMVEQTGGGREFPVEFYAEHLLWTTLGIIRWWLAGDRPMTASKMAAVYVDLVIQPIVCAVLGEPSPARLSAHRQ